MPALSASSAGKTTESQAVTSVDATEYFSRLDSGVRSAYEVATAARAQGKDPELRVDIPIAEDLAARCENLVATIFDQLSQSGLKEGIRELESRYGKNDERVALVIAEQVMAGKFSKFPSLQQAIEAGLRVGVAYLTLGVVTAPLEGISTVRIRDGYIAVYYAGPIRAAGGTAAAMSVLVTDYLRKKAGLVEFKPTALEVKRYVTEIGDYHRLQNLQYAPSEEEIAMIVQNCPICIDGDPTEEQEVSTYKDLSRVETNRIRGGMCLVISEGLAAKAAKLLKKIRLFKEEFGLGHWAWLAKLIKAQKTQHAAKVVGTNAGVTYTSEKYISRVIAGRPVLAHPSRPGGFRLRYGRARTGGLASTAIHPATMWLTEFVAIGTQLATELPGKATVATPCDAIEGPVVKLRDGSVLQLRTKEDAAKSRTEIEEILSLGDVLVPFGEFMSNGHVLLPAAWCEEWWAAEVKAKISENPKSLKEEDVKPFVQKPYPAPPFDFALEVSRRLGVPIHPAYNYFWHDLSKEELVRLIEDFSRAEILPSGEVRLRGFTPETKRALETICAPHSVKDSALVFSPNTPIHSVLGAPNQENLASLKERVLDAKDTISAISSLIGVPVKEKGTVRLGMKMGRPEKAERRLMEGRPQILYPCGEAGGRMRNLMVAYEKTYVSAEFPIFKCGKCAKEINYFFCFDCGQRATQLKACRQCGRATEKTTCHGLETVAHKKVNVNIRQQLDQAFARLGIGQKPELVKGVRGVMGKNRAVEALDKGLLRAKYDLYVNKDGTTRYDATNVPLTHFKPREIGVSVEKLRELGYNKDVSGASLVSADQLVELLPQDIVISDNEDFSAVGYFINIAKFIDELLEKFYGLGKFYNVKSREDLLGHFVIGLAPHTSAGIVGRIIGFTPAKVTLGHPFWHAAHRRNADGDEDSIMLLLDALLNFSREFLPDRRGGRTMDAPLVLTTRIDPQEIDNEAWSIDIESEYPLSFYHESWQYKQPWELSRKIKTVGDVIASLGTTSNRIINIGFTHESSDINDGPTKSKYVKLATMEEKVAAQLELARRLSAVDANMVAEAILEKHFLRDIKGNLRTFASQTFRCVDCNEKYRRPPLAGKCECGGNLQLTVSEGTIRKYLEPSKRIIEAFQVSTFLVQQFMLLEKNIEAMFGKKERQLELAKFA